MFSQRVFGILWMIAALETMITGGVSKTTGCDLAAVANEPTKYTVPLWGRPVTRTCPGSQTFNSTMCQCVGSAIDRNAENIYKGRRGEIWKMPFVLSVRTSSGICTGVLVRWRFALTAKHCITLGGVKNPKDVKGFGGGSEQFQKIEAGVEAFHIDDPNDMDVAILRLDRGFLGHTIFDDIYPIRVAQTSEDDEKLLKKRCTYAGFGLTRDDGSRNKFLYWATTRHSPPEPEICPKETQKTYFCTWDIKGDSNSCAGDSGGPLWCKGDDYQNYLVGTAVHGEVCLPSLADPLVVWARISTYYPYMITVIRSYIKF